jgi:ribosomal protein S18 acetylase RimI-like enzyme
MKTRKATKKDFEEIANLIKTEYLKHYKEKWTKNSALRTLDYYWKVGKIFVAEIEKKVVGFVIVREEYYNDGKSIMVEELVVDGSLQGKGLGRKLMDFVEDYCIKNKIKFVWLITNRKASAFKFYKKIGYKFKENTAYFSKELK